MRKKEFIDFTSERSGVARYRLAEALEAFMDSIPAALAQGDDVRLMGFGNFEIKCRKGRRSCHPGTQEIFYLPEKLVPIFRPGTTMIDAVSTYEAKRKTLKTGGRHN